MASLDHCEYCFDVILDTLEKTESRQLLTAPTEANKLYVCSQHTCISSVNVQW